MTTNSDLDEQQLFLDIPEVARIIGRDARTVRRCVESGEIPGQKFGARWSIPASWVRQQAGITGAPAVTSDSTSLAAEIAAMVVATLADEVVARLLTGRAGVSDGAGAGQ